MKGRLFRLLTMFVVLALTVTALPVSARTSAEIREEIEQLEKEQAQIQEKMDELEQKLSENLEQMEQMVQQKDTIDQQIFLLNEHIINVSEQIRVYAQLVADQQDALVAAQANLDALNEKYKDRIQAMEEGTTVSYWSVLFKASSFAEFLDQINLIQEIAAADQRRMEALAAAAQQVAQAKQTLELEKTALEETRLELENAQTELEAKRQEADALLRQLMEREEEFQALLEESEKQQDELMQQLAQKEDEYDQAKYEEWLKAHPPAPPRAGCSGTGNPCGSL